MLVYLEIIICPAHLIDKKIKGGDLCICSTAGGVKCISSIYCAIVYFMTGLTRGLIPSELGDLLHRPEFGRKITALGRYTLRTQLEGGVAVYKNVADGQMTISRTVLPKVEESPIGNSFDSGILIVDFETGGYRRDIGMLVHSHPGGTDHLGPSVSDLESKDILDGSNPNLIEGIVAATQKMAELLLYRKSSTAQIRPFYQQLDDSPDATAMIRLMNEHGYNTAVAQFAMSDASLLTPVDTIESALFQ